MRTDADIARLSSMPVWDLYRALQMAVTAQEAFAQHTATAELPIHQWAADMATSIERDCGAVVAELSRRTGRSADEIEQRRLCLFQAGCFAGQSEIIINVRSM